MKYKVPAEEKKKKRRFIGLPIIILLMFSAVYAYSFTQEYLRYSRLKSEVKAYELALSKQEDIYAGLQEEKALYFNEVFIERQARKNLGMIKEGETLLFPMKAKDVPLLTEDLNGDYDIH